MKTYILVIILLVSAIGNLFPQLLPVSYPSPEATSLGIVGNIPVSLHTGRADISIPLMEVKSGNYTIPISLSYNSSGVMPELRPGWVGQNWSLDAGGVITRSIKGLPDELATYGFCNSYNRLQTADWASDNNLALTQSAPYVLGAPTLYYDTEPDEFLFRVNGLGGKFYMAGDGTFKVVSDPGIKIECNLNDLRNIVGPSTSQRTFWGFKIIAPDGTIYHFGFDHNLVETASNYLYGHPSLDAYASSWYLSMIEIPNSNEIIRFNYSSKYMDTNVSFIELVTSAAWKWNMGIWSKYSGGCGGPTKYTYLSTLNHIYLNSIESPHFHLSFSTSKANDMKHAYEGNPNWQKLDSITLKNKSGERIKSFAFNYDAGTTTRLYLKSVWEPGKPAYEFQYDSNKSLPYDTKMTDHWGYYNGFSSDANTRIPTTLKIPGDDNEYFLLNRETDPSYVVAGILKQIKYPTGGVVDFEFEANDYSNYYRLINGNLSFLNVQKKWDPDWKYLPYGKDTLDLKNYAYASIRIESKNFSSNVVTLTEMLYPGKYAKRYFLEKAQLSGNPGDYVFYVSYKELVPSSNAYTGGTRIKKVTHKDGASEIIREYKYVKNYTPSDALSVSSGILGSVPVYDYSIDINQRPFGATYSGYYDAQSSQTVSPLTLVDGSHIGYSEVAEIIRDKNRNNLGYTVYKYSNFDSNPDSPPVNVITVLGRDIGARNKNDGERGKLLSQIIYSSLGGKVKENIYVYDTIRRESLRAIQNRRIYLSECEMANVVGFAAVAYNISNNSYLPVKETEITYPTSGQTLIANEKTHTYNQYNLIEETVWSNSNASTKKLKYIYPFDKKSSSPYNSMVLKNILNPIVEKSTYKNGSVFLEKEVYDYALHHSSFYAPTNFKFQKAGSDIETRMNYQYDKKGNPMYISKDGTDRVVYLWSYNYQYPVIEVKGASYEEVKVALGNTVDVKIDLFGADNPSDSEIEAKGADIRRYFSGKPVLVTTYTYQPLVGITSMTDPAGVKTTYKYDGFGRLETILDKDGKIIEHYRYKYQQ